MNKIIEKSRSFTLSNNLMCELKLFTKKGHNSSFYLDETFDFERDISRLSNQKDFNNSLTVYRVKDIQTMQKLQMYLFSCFFFHTLGFS